MATVVLAIQLALVVARPEKPSVGRQMVMGGNMAPV